GLFAPAQENIGREGVLERMVDVIPPPEGGVDAARKGLLFDSAYDPDRGLVASICAKDGQVTQGDKTNMMANEKEYEVTEIGVHGPERVSQKVLTVGDGGYLTASIKGVKDTEVGDTIPHAENGATEPLPGYRQLNPMVYCGLYPVNSED